MRCLALGLFLAACAPPMMGPRPVTYSDDVRPFFIAKCIACHFPNSPTGVDLANPFNETEGIIDIPSGWSGPLTKRVVPGDPDASFLVKKIDGSAIDMSTEGFPMPRPVERVTPAELANIRQWIADGAQNDAFYVNNVVTVFGDAFNLGRRIGKCSYCHTAISVNPPNVVDAFGPRGLVNVNSSYGGKRVVPGDPDNSVLMHKLADVVPEGFGQPMPLNYPAATEAEVKAVREWIAAGAKND
jgi:hypothetical protein